MRNAALRATATIAISPHDQSEAVRLLGLNPETVYSVPTAWTSTTSRRSIQVSKSGGDVAPLVRNDPQGWDEATGTPGSISYTEAEVMEGFYDADTGAAFPVLMFVGRFFAFKRVPMLVRAYAGPASACRCPHRS